MELKKEIDKPKLDMPKRNKYFWEKLGFSISKPQKESEKYNYQKELFKIGQELELALSEINKIRSIFGNFTKNNDKLNLKYFIRFFKTHKEGIRFFYNLENERELFLKFLNSYIKKSNDLNKIHLYNLWLREGRGYCYDISIDKNLLTKLLKQRKGFLIPRMKKTYTTYREEERILLDKQKFLLFVVKRGSRVNNTRLYIGLRVFDSYAKLFLSRGFRPLERNAFLKRIVRVGIKLETIPKEIDTNKLINFVKDPSSIKAPQIDLYGLQFEKNGVVFTLEEDQGIPQENSVNVELKKVLPKNFNFSNLRKISFYNIYNERIEVNHYQISKPVEGVIHFTLNSSGKGKDDYIKAIDIFNSQFGFLPDRAYSDPNQDKKRWYEQFLDNNKFSNYKGLEFPLIAIEVLSELKDKGIINESKKNAIGAICFSKGCPSGRHMIWTTNNTKCPSCGSNLWQVREEFSYEKPISGLKKYVREKANVFGYKTIYLSKKVFNNNIEVIKILNKENEEITVIFSRNKKDIRYLQEFSERSSNIMVIEAGADGDSIQEPIFLQKLSELVYSSENLFNKAIVHQKSNWKKRKIDCANKSSINLIRIHNNPDKSYKGFQFEKDCFNLINNFLDNCVWLGFKDSGGKVPDGIAELKEIELKKGCLIWDCKLSFSKDGAKVGSYKKNKEYVDNLFSNELINSLGGLKSYIIISNNPNEENFMAVFEKIKEKLTGAKKEINYSLITSRQILKIYEYIKENLKYLETNKEKSNDFFKTLNNLLIGEGVKVIKDKEIEEILNKHKITEKDKKLFEDVPTFRSD